MPEDIRNYLEGLPVPKEVKRRAWDAAYSPKGPRSVEEFEQEIGKIDLPENYRTNLRTLHRRSLGPQAPTIGPSMPVRPPGERASLEGLPGMAVGALKEYGPTAAATGASL